MTLARLTLALVAAMTFALLLSTATLAARVSRLEACQTHVDTAITGPAHNLPNAAQIREIERDCP